MIVSIYSKFTGLSCVKNNHYLKACGSTRGGVKKLQIHVHYTCMKSSY